MDRKERQRGDRHDGRRVRDLDVMHRAMPYLMAKRTEAEVYLNETIDVTEALRYLAKREEERPAWKMTLFHLILAGLAKTVVHRPYLNRFISGRRYYERDEVSFSFVAKRQFSDRGEESLMILRTSGDTTLTDVSRTVAGDVEEVRKADGNDLDGIVAALVRLPRPILRLVATALHAMEYYGLVPREFASMLPYYATILIANLGSIRCGAPYHHLTNFGTNSVMVTVGEIHKEVRPAADGTLEVRDVAEMGFTLDERIADGFYFARSIRLFKYLMAHPELLEGPFKEEVELDDRTTLA